MMAGLGDLLLLATLGGDGGVCVDRHRGSSVIRESSSEGVNEDMAEMRPT
jgi:hypothetical protein